jgi:hypothetical protein
MNLNELREANRRITAEINMKIGEHINVLPKFAKIVALAWIANRLRSMADDMSKEIERMDKEGESHE